MNEPKEMHGVWGVLQDPETKQILLVVNRRRGDKVDWSLPGGLVDKGESSTEALTREVEEETNLVVDSWARLLYTNRIEYRSRSEDRKDLNFNTEVYLAAKWSGTLTFSDPDQIVEHGLFARKYLVQHLLRDNGRQIYEPFHEWLNEPWERRVEHFSYRVEVHGANQKILRVETK